MLRNVSVRNLSTTVLGRKVNFPIGISPSALQKLAHEDGEIGNARGISMKMVTTTIKMIFF